MENKRDFAENKSKSQGGYFTTRDIYLASTLISLMNFMVGTDYQYEGDRNRPTAYFKFKESPQILETVQNYWNGRLAVEPKGFVSIFLGLKGMISGDEKDPSKYNDYFESGIEPRFTKDK